MKTIRIHCSLFVLVVLSISCTSAGEDLSVQPIQGLPQGSDGYPWWNDTVFYEVFVRSFYDSNGDGIGDLAGLISKLDYLNDGNPQTTQDLGITAIWLMPIHPAASYHGYDVTDYFAVNPDYGSLEDFKRLLVEAHRRGIRVIIDLVLNHTSNQHPWFVESQNPSSQYRDWYVWSDTEPSGSGWHQSGSGFYYGIFEEGMPDLNYRNDVVTRQMQEVVRFWLEEVGVDGFRLDAAKHLVEEGIIQSHAQETHTWFKSFRSFYKGLEPLAITVGEVWDASPAVSKYVSGEELDLAFSFDLAQAMVTSARLGNAEAAARILNRETGLFPQGQFATFLTNHDQDRVMLLFRNEIGKARVAASLLLTSPGVPFIYYGEEIGMIGKKPDEQIRTPMQWTDEENAGFTTGEPWISPYPDFGEGKNVASQSADDSSLLSYYRALIQVRNQHVALRVGEFILLESNEESVMAYLRISDKETLLVIINLGINPVRDFALSLQKGPLSGSYLPKIVFGENGRITELIASDQGGFEFYRPVSELKAQDTLILQLQLGK